MLRQRRGQAGRDCESHVGKVGRMEAQLVPDLQSLGKSSRWREAWPASSRELLG